MIDKFYNLGKELFPLNRSITGKDTLKTLKIIQKEFKNLKIRSIKSGTKVFDWTIPPVWNVHDAFILDKSISNKLIALGKYLNKSISQSSK